MTNIQSDEMKKDTEKNSFFVGTIGDQMGYTTDNETERIVKAVTDTKQKLPQEVYSMDSLGIVNPKTNRGNLALLARLDETHSAAIQLKTFACAGKGYEFLTDNNLPEMKEIIKWAKNPSGRFGYTLDDHFLDIFNDMHIYSQVFVEVVSSKRRNPKIYRADPSTMFVKPRRDARNIPLSGAIEQYVQIVKDDRSDGHYTYFRPYNGKTRNIARHFILETRFQSEIDPYYGYPAYMPILKYIMENNYISEFNTKFFKQGAKISYAILITGHEFTDKEKKDVSSYTNDTFIGLNQAHKMFTLSFSEPDANIQFIPMTKGFDAAFMDLRMANRDSIALGDSTPSKILGIASAGNVGGGSEDISAMKKWQETVISVYQRKIERLYNALIEAEFGIDPQLRFNKIDITNEKDDAVMNNLYFRMVDEKGNRVLNINEIRKKQGFIEKAMKSKIIDPDFLDVYEQQKMGLIGNNNKSDGDTNNDTVTITSEGKTSMGNNNLDEDSDKINDIKV